MGDLEQKIRESLEDGFTPREISKAMEEDGYSHQQIRQAFRNVKQQMESQKQQNARQKKREQGSPGSNTGQNVKDQGQPRDQQPSNSRQPQQNGNQQQSRRENPQENQAAGRDDVLEKIDFTSDEYTIKQSLIRNRYKIMNDRDEVILRAKQKLFKLKEDFPFKDPDGEVVFRVKGESIIDVAGDYSITDEATGEPIAILDRKYTLFFHKWRIRDPENEALLARIKTHNKTVQALRIIGDAVPYVPNFFGFIPHKYDIEDNDGNELGEIQGKFSLRDIYRLKLENAGKVPREALVAAAISVDALEAN